MSENNWIRNSQSWEMCWKVQSWNAWPRVLKTESVTIGRESGRCISNEQSVWNTQMRNMLLLLLKICLNIATLIRCYQLLMLTLDFSLTNLVHQQNKDTQTMKLQGVTGAVPLPFFSHQYFLTFHIKIANFRTTTVACR